MSRATSFLTSPTSPTSDLKTHYISLTDRTIAQEPLSSTTTIQEPSDAERSDSEVPASNATTTEPLIRKATSSSIRTNLQQQINRQKYARYQSSRYEQNPEEPRERSAAPQGMLERSRAKAADLLKRRKALGKNEERDTVLDILYENQRGSFFFGIPRYSSKSLLQIDPQAWQNADFRTSAVDIRNAQVPDLSWEWAWKSWYVDMSRDVDEEGWEYSFAFPPQFAWHGNHPWFHSFVRRRRWLRKRIRKSTTHKTKEKSHELSADYFTIHTKALSAGSQAERTWDPLRNPEDEKLEDVDVPDILALTRYMSKARIDREKLLAVRKFTQQGGDDLHYLADRMPEIMSLFIYQSSRRQLLSELIQHHDATVKRRNSLSNHTHDDDEEAKQAHNLATRKADNLLNAISAAEEQVQKLEYWSDIKAVAQDETTTEGKRWQGVNTYEKNVFKSKQAADAPAAELHDGPEQQKKDKLLEKQRRHDKDLSQETDTSAYTTARSEASEKREFVSAQSSEQTYTDETGGNLERFVTASEGPVSSIKPRQIKNQLASGQQLDGVAEEESQGTAREA